MDIATIQNRIKMIEDLEKENRTLKEMLESELDSDETYKNAHKTAKEAISARRQVKERIFGKPECERTISDVKANNEEISTLKEIIATELTEYYEKNKTNKILGPDGQERKFKISVRFVPNTRE